MSDIVYCKDCAYAEPNNLDAYHAAKIGVFCKRYRQNTAGIRGCDNGKPKQKTNADRIRNMTDEELAKWIAGEQINGIYAFLKGLEDDDLLHDFIEEINLHGAEQIKKEKLEWLKQEAET